MPIYDRNADTPGRRPNWWLDYRITRELQRRHALTSARIREPGCDANRKQSERLLARRLAEVEAGTWKPSNLAASTTFRVLADRWVARRESDGVRTSKDEAGWLARYAVPVLGADVVSVIDRERVRVLVNDLVQNGKLAPRSVHHVYRAIQGVMQSAVPDLLEHNPCTLKVKPGELPPKRDKDPRWRSRAVFAHGEIYKLATDERIPQDRRAFWALLGCTGARFGEAAGLRVDDYDRHALPLGRLRVETQYDGEGLKGDAPPRDVPVHPFLASVLEQWLASDFALVLGREPKPTDYLIPSRRFDHRSLKHMEHRLEQDLERLGLRHRSPHAFRRAFISLTQGDGGSSEVLRCVTHSGTGRGRVWDGYSQLPWSALCEHVAKLRLPASWSQPWSHEAGNAAFVREPWRDGRDLKPGTLFGISSNRAESTGPSLARYAKILGIPLAGGHVVTPDVTMELRRDLERAADHLRSGAVLPRNERERLAVAVDVVKEGLPALDAQEPQERSA